MATTITRRVEFIKPGSTVLVSKSYSADRVISDEIAVADESTDLEVQLELTLSRIKWLSISSDQAVTVLAKDGSTTGADWDIQANGMVEWQHDSPLGNPINLNSVTKITKLLVTNASGSNATLKIEVGYDPTP